MSKWWKVYHDVMNDPKVQMLSPREFKAAFLDALDGKPSPFNRWVKRGSDRPSAEVWSIIRARIFERDNYTCQYCGAHGVKLECDHVMPVSRGGSNSDTNLLTACLKCNRSKRAKTLEEWSLEQDARISILSCRLAQRSGRPVTLMGGSGSLDRDSVSDARIATAGTITDA